MALYSLTDCAMLSEVGDEYVLLDSNNAQYFSLDSIGKKMLDLMLGENNFEEMISTLNSEFDASDDTLLSDLKSLAKSLVDAGLIKLQNCSKSGDLLA